MAMKLPDNVLATRLDTLANWVRRNSLWPMPFGTACCGIELMAVGASRHDIARFGAEVMRFSPRQCDVMIVAGRIAMKMMPVLQRIWLQMPEPKWCISMGACASSGGVFDTYAVVQGVDRFMPVDVFIPGCPPRPEQIIQALLDLQEKIRATGTLTGKEFAERTKSEAPLPLARNLDPAETVVAPGDFATSTRLRNGAASTPETEANGSGDDRHAQLHKAGQP
jgi:NADH-quinone oxidoreductase subunit B